MNTLRLHQRRSTSRSGFSLLEMVAATALVAGTLVPALTFMRDAMSVSREAHMRSLLSNFAVMKLEEQTSVAMLNWTNLTENGNLGAYGHSELGYELTQSDDPADGGIAGQLMSISVTIFDDPDASGTSAATEIQVTFRTKISKLLSYENENI